MNSFTKNQVALAALAMDLRRVALGYHRGSVRMAERFWQEAKRRRQEIDTTQVKPYLRVYLEKLDASGKGLPQDLAEDLLTYSILFQNAATQKPVTR